MPTSNLKYEIGFGEPEDKASDIYNSMNVSLGLHADNEHGAEVAITFRIEEKSLDRDEGVERNLASKHISLEEAKHLIEKLKCFVSRGEKFLEEYKEQ